MANSNTRQDIGPLKSGRTPLELGQLKIGGEIIYEAYHQKNDKREPRYGKIVNWSESGNVWIETPHKGLIQLRIEDIRLKEEGDGRK